MPKRSSDVRRAGQVQAIGIGLPISTERMGGVILLRVERSGPGV